ncbi:MAG: hypothetical protein AAGA69_12350, partial [Pseudomonadota bacterium]
MSDPKFTGTDNYVATDDLKGHCRIDGDLEVIGGNVIICASEFGVAHGYSGRLRNGGIIRSGHECRTARD